MREESRDVTEIRIRHALPPACRQRWPRAHGLDRLSRALVSWAAAVFHAGLALSPTLMWFGSVSGLTRAMLLDGFSLYTVWVWGIALSLVLGSFTLITSGLCSELARDGIRYAVRAWYVLLEGRCLPDELFEFLQVEQITRSWPERDRRNKLELYYMLGRIGWLLGQDDEEQEGSR